MKNVILILIALSTLTASASELPQLVVTNKTKREFRRYGSSLTISCVELACENLKFHFRPYDDDFGSGIKIVNVKDLYASVTTNSTAYPFDMFQWTQSALEDLREDVDTGRRAQVAASVFQIALAALADTVELAIAAPVGGIEAASHVLKNKRAHSDREQILEEFMDATTNGKTNIVMRDRQFKKYNRIFKAVFYN